jgi:hypothetical protein
MYRQHSGTFMSMCWEYSSNFCEPLTAFLFWPVFNVIFKSTELALFFVCLQTRLTGTDRKALRYHIFLTCKRFPRDMKNYFMGFSMEKKFGKAHTKRPGKLT